MTATSLEPPTDLVTVEVSGSSDSVLITATGEIDASTAPVLIERLDAVVDGRAGEFTIDLRGVTFLDSAGLCALASAHRRASAAGVRMRVLASSRAVIRPLQITGLWALLNVEQVSA